MIDFWLFGCTRGLAERACVRFETGGGEQAEGNKRFEKGGETQGERHRGRETGGERQEERHRRTETGGERSEYRIRRERERQKQEEGTHGSGLLLLEPLDCALPGVHRFFPAGRSRSSGEQSEEESIAKHGKRIRRYCYADGELSYVHGGIGLRSAWIKRKPS